MDIHEDEHPDNHWYELYKQYAFSNEQGGKCLNCFRLEVYDNSGFCEDCKLRKPKYRSAINYAFPMDGTTPPEHF